MGHTSHSDMEIRKLLKTVRTNKSSKTVESNVNKIKFTDRYMNQKCSLANCKLHTANWNTKLFKGQSKSERLAVR